MGGRAKRILPFYSKEAEELHVDLPNQRHPELCHSEQVGGSRSQSKAGAGQNTVRDRSSELFNVLFSVGNNQLTRLHWSTCWPNQRYRCSGKTVTGRTRTGHVRWDPELAAVGTYR
jgi:hypothetical protein